MSISNEVSPLFQVIFLPSFKESSERSLGQTPFNPKQLALKNDFDPQKIQKSFKNIFYKRDIMQLFSADATQTVKSYKKQSSK